METKYKHILIITISYLYVFLFIYTAFNKLIDFQTFKSQLGQSPLLSAFAEWITYGIPILEIAISCFLLFSRFKYEALLAAYSLMIMFTTYIFIILNYSSFIPCSCGGIISEMNWTQHLIFNMIMLLIAVIALLLVASENLSTRKGIYHIIICSVVSSIAICILFLLSESEIHRNNAFIRRYPHHPITTIKGTYLGYNSYYIAGFEKGNILLGNTSAPLHLLRIDTLLHSTEKIRIQILDNKNYPFKSVQVIINSPNFYLADGTVPIIYKGTTSDWVAKTLTDAPPNFSILEVTQNDDFIIRSNTAVSGEHILGRINSTDNFKFETGDTILEKKVDGVFDTDGMLTYNKYLNKVIYTYYYRNNFIITDNKLDNRYVGKTIDTVSQVPLVFSYLSSKSEKKLAKQPFVINKYSTSENKYLFIKSDRLGKYESEEISKQASIIDVYDLEKQTYEFSFYLYHYKNEEVMSFKIYNNLLIGLTKNYLIKTELKSNRFKLKE